jgi:hypothetical protein
VSISLLTSGGAASSNDNTAAVTLNTTGASLIVLSAHSRSGTYTVADTSLNTWTALTGQGANQSFATIYYCASPTTGIADVFTVTDTSEAPCVNVLVFSGTAASPFDQQNGANTAFNHTLATGSITPGSNNEVVVGAVTGGETVSYSVSGVTGMVISSQQANTVNNRGAALAYVIQTTLAASNATFTGTNGDNSGMGAVIASFKAAAAAATGGYGQLLSGRRNSGVLRI